MAVARPARIGVVALVLGGIVVGGVALATSSSERGTSGQTASTDAAASVATTAEPEADTRETPTAPAAPVEMDADVQAQLDYALTYWSDYNTADYGVVDGNDCVNFTSQSLVARGWAMDEDWYTSGTGSDFDFSSPWVSSTAFMNYLADSGRATALTDDQRDQVKLGDVVQFDWDNSGDRDHTAVVSRIEGSGDDIVIYYAGHTDDSDYLSVDFAITEKHPGGTAYYWSIP